ncbi:MAG: phytanoyl-CoA dioxygenase family protein [Pseudobacteriovorax sp.]|nr:phytanoyl-CoA dioxygenase family protein [Pseudobacteriovorax sp.]
MNTLLTPEQKKMWFEEGYIYIPGFFSAEQCDAIANLHTRIWRDKPSDVVVDDLMSGERLSADKIPESKAQMRYKINDLFLKEDSVRQLALEPKLVKVLAELMADDPVLINSLSLDYGTQQPLHADSLYMTPPTPFNLAATWIALEDADEDSGPLAYYPGSHMITPYRFSHGRHQAVNDEMSNWQRYMDKQIETFGLEEKRFCGKKGDLFVWSSYLYHGGKKAKDESLTRKSIVFHYFSKAASHQMFKQLESLNGGYWQKRSPISLPSPAALDREAEEVVQKEPEAPIDLGDKKVGAGPIERFVRTSIHHARNWYRDVTA